MILAHGRGFLFCFFRNTHGRATVEDQIPNNDRWAGARAPQPAALRGGGGALAHATRPLPTGGGGCKPLSHAFPQLRRRTRSTTQATIGGGVRARGGSISFSYHPILILLRRPDEEARLGIGAAHRKPSRDTSTTTVPASNVSVLVRPCSSSRFLPPAIKSVS